MEIIPLLLKELDFEVGVARKILALVPEDKPDWKPHAKSTAMKDLGIHIAELPSWIELGFKTKELDFETSPYTPTPVNGTTGLLELLEKSFQSGNASLEGATEADLLPMWTLRSGQHILAVMTRYELIRHTLNQITHHRAQMGVYLRILNIPIPGSYGPSADEMNF
jgi:uncharacterized damage-inducible protein DinB